MTTSINVSTLMIEDEDGLEIAHILDHPELYKSLAEIAVPKEIQEEVGTDLDKVSLIYYDDPYSRYIDANEFIKDTTDQVAYLIPELPYWSITLCRKGGMLWGKLQTPLIH